MNLDQNDAKHYIINSTKGKIFSKENYIEYDIQNIVLENFIEVILLKLLDTDCGLLSNKLRQNVNSKNYIESLSEL